MLTWDLVLLLIAVVCLALAALGIGFGRQPGGRHTVHLGWLGLLAFVLTFLI